MSYINCRRIKDSILVWIRDENGDRTTVTYPGIFEFYSVDERGNNKSVFNKKLLKHEFSTYYAMENAKQPFVHRNELLYESDIGADLKVLAHHYYEKPAPKLHYTMFDIEVDYDPKRGFSSIDDPYAPVNAVALYQHWCNKSIVIAVPPKGWDHSNRLEALAKETDTEIHLVANEETLLDMFLTLIEDSDCLSGWNSDMFDMPYIAKRIEAVLTREDLKRLSFPEAVAPSYDILNKFGKDHTILKIGGRISWDYMELFKKFEMSGRPSYSLEAISNELLPDLPKLAYDGTLAQLYNNDFEHFIRYNIRDTHVLRGFEQKLGYLALANDFYHSACGLPQQVFGTIRLADLSFINYCHYVLNKKVPDWDQYKADGTIHGAMVLTPQVGLHSYIGSVDITSLYPSAIRCLNISAETLIGQFDGTYSNDDRKVHTAWKAVFEDSDQEITITYDKNASGWKGTETHSASDWRIIFLERKWAISGSGTIFRQDEQGMIPAVLTDWFTQRKKYNKMKKAAFEVYKKLMAPYEDESDAPLDEQEKIKEAYSEYSFYDRRQYVYKIKLNSAYGALSNYRFRFFELAMGQSTTGTGRAILEHMCSQIALNLDGKYDMFSESIAYGDSVGSDSLIQTATGQVKICDLFTNVDNSIGDKEYCHPTNLQTLTYDESGNISCFKPIKYIMRHKASKQMYRVWITNSNYVDVTEDHSLMGYVNTKFRKKGESCLTEIKPQELGNTVKSLVYAKHIPRTLITSKGLSKELYELLGLIVGDGGANHRGSGVELSIGSTDINEISTKLLEPLKSQNLITSYFTMKNGHDIRICGTKLWDICRDLLYVNDVKVVPEWLNDETEENICSFLRGYFTADGTITGSVVRLSSTRLDNIQRVQQLLLFCGISSTYFTETTENSFKGKFSGTFSKNLVVKSKKVYRNKIGFILDRKQQAIPKNGWKDDTFSNYDFNICSINKVEKIQYDDYVYDIEVEDTHTFFANNILVHNTDSCYFKTNAEHLQGSGYTKAQIEDMAIAIADDIGEKVNNSFNDFCVKAFCVQPQFLNIIACAREAVAKKGIFVAKKRYVLKLIDLDGNRTDKQKAMGLEMKKTTTPKHIQKFLVHVVDLILNDEHEWKYIEDYIVDYRTQLMTTDDVLMLGLPKGVQKVEFYLEQYKLNPKTRIPGHVAATLFYNECLKEFNDVSNLPIISGTKIRVLYLNQKYGRFQSIAIPTDNETIPEWFHENFVVDREKHELRLIDNNLEKIFTAIGKEVPTLQTQFSNELLIW
jgi:DNA polymerase elongation subunit (family B)/intein/homing endonuclease